MPPTVPRPAPRAAKPRDAGPPPTRSALHEAALRHLTRFATTEAGLVRVLDRKIDRWARQAGQDGQDADQVVAGAATARAAVRQVAHALVQAGAVNDAAFAEARSRTLARSGRSRRGVLAHLEAKGVPSDLARQVLPDGGGELASAVAYARRRRLGPFRVGDVGPDTWRKDLAALARAGFPADVARHALRLERDAAEALVAQLRQP